MGQEQHVCYSQNSCPATVGGFPCTQDPNHLYGAVQNDGSGINARSNTPRATLQAGPHAGDVCEYELANGAC